MRGPVVVYRHAKIIFILPAVFLLTKTPLNKIMLDLLKLQEMHFYKSTHVVGPLWKQWHFKKNQASQKEFDTKSPGTLDVQDTLGLFLGVTESWKTLTKTQPRYDRYPSSRYLGGLCVSKHLVGKPNFLKSGFIKSRSVCCEQRFPLAIASENRCSNLSVITTPKLLYLRIILSNFAQRIENRLWQYYEICPNSVICPRELNRRKYFALWSNREVKKAMFNHTRTAQVTLIWFITLRYCAAKKEFPTESAEKGIWHTKFRSKSKRTKFSDRKEFVRDHET